MKELMTKLIEDNQEKLIIDVNQIGQRLKYLREYGRLTVREIAEEFGTSTGTICKYENGRVKASPSITIITEYVKYFHVSLEFILYGITEEEKQPVSEEGNEKHVPKNLTKESEKKKGGILNSSEIGKRLKDLREEYTGTKKFSQEKMAEKLDKKLKEELKEELDGDKVYIEQKMISDLERGERLPSLKVLVAYHLYFNISMEAILFGSDPFPI